MEEKTQVSLKCLYCNSDQFVFPEEDYHPQPGEKIECANCGKLNDYDSLIRVVERKALEWGEAQARGLMDEFAKDLSRMLK